jgi:hypothetical protein
LQTQLQVGAQRNLNQLCQFYMFSYFNYLN